MLLSGTTAILILVIMTIKIGVLAILFGNSENEESS